MSLLSWMPLYVGDYRGDTPHLNAAQHGAYLLLIMHYWQHAGLPDDDEQLARIACMPLAEWRRNRQLIRAFFSDGWRHKRIDKELAGAVESYEKRSQAGRKGNAKRWGTGRNAIAMGSQPQPQPQPHSLRETTIQGAKTYQDKVLGPDAGRFAVIPGGAAEGGR
jgi:uncharacterized protein YdaU (DUF1376 family)